MTGFTLRGEPEELDLQPDDSVDIAFKRSTRIAQARAALFEQDRLVRQLVWEYAPSVRVQAAYVGRSGSVGAQLRTEDNVYGVGKLEILIPNLFKEIAQGEPATVKFNIFNSGTLVLRRVAAELDLPLDWEGETEPAEFEMIPAGEKVHCTAHLTTPEDVAVGTYTVTLQSEGHSGVDVVEATEKDLTIRIASRGNITGTVILIAVLVILVLGIAVASIRISRR